MDIINIARQRYATKAFDSSFALNAEQLAAIKSLLQLSPSSVNSQPWHFVLATTAAGKARLAHACPGKFAANAEKINAAAAAVVLCAKIQYRDDDIDALVHQEISDRRFANQAAAEPGRQVRQFYIDLHRQAGDLDQWMAKQVYLNCGNLLLGCAALGLDAVPIEGFDPDLMDAELALPEQGLRATLVVAIGQRHPEDANAQLPKSRFPVAEIITEI